MKVAARALVPACVTYFSAAVFVDTVVEVLSRESADHTQACLQAESSHKCVSKYFVSSARTLPYFRPSPRPTRAAAAASMPQQQLSVERTIAPCVWTLITLSFGAQGRAAADVMKSVPNGGAVLSAVHPVASVREPIERCCCCSAGVRVV